jgi:hypothetical protein
MIRLIGANLRRGFEPLTSLRTPVTAAIQRRGFAGTCKRDMRRMYRSQAWYQQGPWRQLGKPTPTSPLKWQQRRVLRVEADEPNRSRGAIEKQIEEAFRPFVEDLRKSNQVLLEIDQELKRMGDFVKYINAGLIMKWLALSFAPSPRKSSAGDAEKELGGQESCG